MVKTLRVLQSESHDPTLIGYDFESFFQELATRGDADLAIVSTEEGFSPLGASGKFFEDDLGISYNDVIRPLARWNQDENEAVTLIALASRNPNSLLKGVILAPGQSCRSYQPFASRYSRNPHRDYYYNVSYEAVGYACSNWGARKIAISHLSASGKFHQDIATCHVEALSHFCENHPLSAPTNFTFCGCCISADHLEGVQRLNTENNGSHRAISLNLEVKSGAVLIHLNWL